jgi:ABC-type glycerol-3-phosphate transport system substrate-binding protein
MKKLVAVLLAMLLFLSITACGSTEVESSATSHGSEDSESAISGNDQSDVLSTTSNSQALKGSSSTVSSKTGGHKKPTASLGDITTSGSKTVKLPPSNQKGKTVKILSWNDPKSEEMLEWAADFKKHFGGTLEFLPTNWGEIGETLTKLVMANNGPDVTFLRNVDNPVLMYKGVLKELNNLIDFNSELWKGMEFYNSYLKIDNNRYMATTSAGVQEVLWYNVTIFENSGLETPQELYDSGKLDYDKLLSLAKELTITKDGATTQYSLGAHQAGTFGNAILAAHDLDFVKRSGNLYVNNLYDSEIAECMTYLYGLYNTEKVMCPDATSLSNFAKGKLAMFVAPTWIALTDPIKSMHKKKQITFSLMPKAKGKANTINWVDFQMYGISKNAKNPEGGAALLNMLRFNNVNQEKMDEASAKSKKKGFTDKEIDYMRAGLKHSRALEYLGFGDMGVLMWGAMFYMTSEGTTWNTSRETYAPEADKYIDTINSYLKK